MGGIRRPRGGTGKPNEAETSRVGQFLSKGWWVGVGSIAGVIAIGGAVAAVIAILPSGQHTTQSTSYSSMLDEQNMVSSLIAGDTYAKLQYIIGAIPDKQMTLKSGRTLYQFDRPWEYIDLLVENGNVLSVGVYAKTTAFRATLDVGGYHVILNGPPIAQQATGASGTEGAVGTCGGNIGAYFFEGFSLPQVYQDAAFALGWIDYSSQITVPLSACDAVDNLYSSPLYGCSKLQNFNGYPSSRFLDCLNSSKLGQSISQLSPTAVVVTASPQGIVPDMLGIEPADFIFLGPSGLYSIPIEDFLPFYSVAHAWQAQFGGEQAPDQIVLRKLPAVCSVPVPADADQHCQARRINTQGNPSSAPGSQVL